MAHSARCLKFVVLAFSVLFAVSSLAVTAVGIANLVHFYIYGDFVPGSVSSPLLLLSISGLFAALGSALGWSGAMTSNTCRLHLFSLFLVTIVVTEFSSGVWALTSRAAFEDEMIVAMETSFSTYLEKESVRNKWKSLQREMECCGVDGPNNYNQHNRLDLSCCVSETSLHGNCQMIRQRGCAFSLSEDIRQRLLWVSLVAIGVAILQASGVLCSFCLSNSLKNEARKNRLRNRHSTELKSLKPSN
ncbi:23 kDa integral membrane protein-like [Periplaneta americana]|uniref:23 kDa integral membrane protein-like n=1 Tax=Periplaneta americana TaxID=6978 RepID=UPI0037E9468C